MKTINFNKWNRKEHFEFFSTFDEPFFGLSSEVDCSLAYRYSKDNNISFFAYYLYKSLEAVNCIDEFKYRIVDNDVVIYNSINASPTIGRDDGTFGFSFIEFSKDFDMFSNNLNKEIVRVKNTSGLSFNMNVSRHDVIHFSSIPWIKFTGLTHARKFNTNDSIPKITFGKAYRLNEKFIMPISINAHHGLMDGLHIAKFLELYQKLLDNR